MEIEEIITGIADALMGENPHPTLIYAARYAITEFDRRFLPDWIEALANGNPEIWNEVVDEVRRLKTAEEMDDDNDDIDS